MILDAELQAQSGWKSHTQADGSNIGGVAPLAYGMAQGMAGAPTAALFQVRGSTVKGGYADWEAYLDRPILPNTGSLQLSLDLTVDENAAEFAQCIEIDTILCVGGFKYNFSHQLDYASGTIDIAEASGAWASIAHGVQKLSPLATHHFALSYKWDEATHAYSFVSVEIDGAMYPVPAPLQNLQAQPTPWRDGAMLQVQQDLNALAGGFSMLLDHVQYAWE